jgi:hypothetical protein
MEQDIRVVLTKNEKKHYTTFSAFCKFKSADEEYKWAETQIKPCNKCHKVLPLTCFGFSTSGRFPFNKDGVRYRRGDCISCRKNLDKGKRMAQKDAQKNGLSIRPNEKDCCCFCDETKGLVFDHNHDTNKFRGWLCDPCNRAIGTIESRGGKNWKEKVINY